MIYLIDCPVSERSHSQYLIDIIKRYTQVEIKVIPISKDITIYNLFEVIHSLCEIVLPKDIVLCAWAVPGNDDLDMIFQELSSLCNVIAAAGNFKEPIENYTPARSPGVIAVGTLNKMGLVAALSNYSSTKEIIWIPGTNFNVGWKNSSGTSISAALYAAFLAESIEKNDMNLVNEYIEKEKERVFLELKQTF